MDSLTQIALGSAVTVAVMGRRTAVWKSALWGAVAGTLPDLDAFIDHGDAVLNMVLHRAESHALLFLTLGAPVLAWIVARLHGEGPLWRRWWLALWLALVTHPLLDTMTVYGTQLLQPFSDHPFGVGSLFIIDPAYTLPLLAGVIAVLCGARLRWNQAGLALSTLYIGWSVLAQQHATEVARADLESKGVDVQQLLVTPAPLNTVLWRLVAMTPTHYLEGHYGLLDDDRQITWTVHERGADLEAAVAGHAGAQRIRAFSHGYYSLSRDGDNYFITDLRMGQEPSYVFRFDLADGSGQTPTVGRGARNDLDSGLRWLSARVRGIEVPSPGAQAPGVKLLGAAELNAPAQ